MIEPLRIAFVVKCPPDHAFTVWTEKTTRWWPISHTVTEEPGLEVTFEPQVGGRIYERTSTGQEVDWGQITAWEPPRRLGYLWHINADRSDATDVEITFVDQGDQTTRIVIEHRGWERLGDRGLPRRNANQNGWNGLLPHFIAFVEGS